MDLSAIAMAHGLSVQTDLTDRPRWQCQQRGPADSQGDQQVMDRHLQLLTESAVECDIQRPERKLGLVGHGEQGPK